MVDKDELRVHADQGDKDAQFALAEMYWEEQGGKGSPDANNGEALEWLRKAAEQGHARAAMRLCVCYMRYLGDESEGLKWYKIAIAAGHAHCGDALGIEAPVYRDLSVWRKQPVSPREKLPRERRLARRGDPDAQYRLGALFANGAGVSLDFVQAYAWFVVAGRPELNQSITSPGKHRAISDWGTPGRAVRVLEQVMEESEMELARSLAKDFLSRFGGRVGADLRLLHFAEGCATWLCAIFVILPVLMFRGIWKRVLPPNAQP